MFTQFMKNITTKKFTRNISKQGIYDTAAIGLCIFGTATTTLIAYKHVQFDRIRERIWIDEVLKKKSD